MRNKVILVDCDGVLLDWEYAFDRWMKRHGYEILVDDVYKMDVKYGLDITESKKLCRMFNESATIRRLPPLRDAIKYVKKLHEEHGYVFHAITSLSDDEYAQHLRTKNLTELFGPTAFETFAYLPCGADKDEALAKYKNTLCWWIEDKTENARAGELVGLSPLLMAHPHNQDAPYTRVQNWKEIYDIIIEN